MPEAVVTHAVRTPIGRFLGQFQEMSAVDLGIAALKGLMNRSGLSAAEVDYVVMGCARQAGLGPNPARQVAVLGGLDHAVPAYTVNMACGSGLQAVVEAARMIRAGEADCVLVGGMENMTRVPHLLPSFRLGYRMGHSKVVDAMYQDGFTCPMADQLMGATAETLARQYEITREEQDAYAARSQNRCEAARKEGRFDAELTPVTVRDRKGNETAVLLDEHARNGVTANSLAQLPPVFDPKAGTVTAGNSSGITDGAAVLLLMSAEAARGRGFEPLATVEAFETAGVDPKVMGIGPVPAVRRLLERTHTDMGSFDLIELNEAFAAQVLACDRELAMDPERLNVNGGSIALGHPIGATGARIATTLLHAMVARGAQRGLATLCISGGQGLAVSFRRN